MCNNTERKWHRQRREDDLQDQEIKSKQNKICKICDFVLDHEVKKKKLQTTCPQCGDTVHERCLSFDGCIC